MKELTLPDETLGMKLYYLNSHDFFKVFVRF